MSLIDVILDKIVPHDCLSCGQESDLLCLACQMTLPPFPSRCYRCHESSIDGKTCDACLAGGVYRVNVATTYSGVAKDLIWSLKLAGAQSSARIMAQQMIRLISTSDSVIVPVPTATSRMRQRGYDQAKLLARELRRLTGLPYYDCLSRSGQMHQHGLSRTERLSQLKAAYRVKWPTVVAGARILLVDDVMTTGSTLEAAASVLIATGAERVEAVVFAQPRSFSD